MLRLHRGCVTRDDAMYKPRTKTRHMNAYLNHQSPPPIPRSPVASIMAKRCAAVFAFLLFPNPVRAPFFLTGVSTSGTGVAVPEAFAD